MLTNGVYIAVGAWDIQQQKAAEKTGKVCEANGLLQNPDGCTLDTKKAWLFTVGSLAATDIGQWLTPVKYKKFWEYTRIGVSAGRVVFGVRLNL